MDYGEFLVCLERRMKEWGGGKMKTCEACVNKSTTIGCRHGVVIENAPPWDLEETYGCTLWEAGPIEFEAVVISRQDYTCPQAPFIVVSRECKVGRQYKVTLELLEDK